MMRIAMEIVTISKRVLEGSEIPIPQDKKQKVNGSGHNTFIKYGQLFSMG